jgi:predicted PurR-regulated permease PerM
LKPLIIIIILTVLLIVGGCLSLYALNSESQQLNSNLSTLEEDIENENWNEASRKLEEFHDKWDKTSLVWSMLVDHYEIDNIELIMSQLISYVKTQDKNEALSKTSSLRTLIKHIPVKESFKLQNVF